MPPNYRILVVIPVYDHEQAIGGMVDGVLATGLECLLVDDGSSPACARVLDELATRHAPRVGLVRLPVNQGKGAAVLAGFAEAARRGYTHVLQIDADGQHDAGDIPRFIELSQAHPDSIIAGAPQYDESVPAARHYGRYFCHLWVWINTLSFTIRDSMCGFRIYPLAPVMRLVAREHIGLRMDFDIEIIIRLFWRGVPVRNLATRVTYPSDGVSHFDVLRDNLRITRMHTRLFFGMLRRAPLWLIRGRGEPA